MRAALIVVLALGLVAQVSAECANACSGHGVCRNSDQCDCFPNYNAADCSQRVCPYGLAFIDNLRGDLDHNGMRQVDDSGNLVPVYTFTNGNSFTTDSPVTVSSWETYNPAAKQDEAHFYSECSNKGLCDRSTGLCTCFDGYTGSSCQRSTCANDCSGHGICRTVDEIAAGNLPAAVAVGSAIFDSTTFGGLNKRQSGNTAAQVYHTGVISSTLYRLWDQDMAQACVCDPGFSGPDCSRRECPRGDDPLTHRFSECPFQTGMATFDAASACRNEVQRITVAGGAVGQADWFRILYRDWTGKIWSTDNFVLGAACTDATIPNIPYPLAAETTPGVFSAAIKTLLKAIPNSIIDDVTVTVPTFTSTASFVIQVSFTKNSGNLYPLEFVNSLDMNLNLPLCLDTDKDMTATYVSIDGNTEAATCSNRGVCDYDSGLCKCFKGYYGGDCSFQNALSQ